MPWSSPQRAAARVAGSRTASRPVPHRTLADAPSVQALTHPTRLALIEAIGVAGTLTATQASRLVGASAAACAYHLRTLARLGFIEVAAGGRGRERPWRLAQAGLSVAGDGGDLEFAAAAQALSTALIERYIARIRAFELARSKYPEDIQAVTGTEQGIVFGTPAELAGLREQIGTLLRQYADRMDPARRPPGSVPFEVVTFTHVLPAGEAGAQTPSHP